MRADSGPFDLTSIGRFSSIIDVRSPAEFADDHIPGAINAPVLSNEERIEVGTLFKQVSPFVARRRGAALVSENISRHLTTLFADKPQHWAPLVMCWRGGQRSGAMTHILRAVGWNATQLPGGYKAWRRHVIATLEERPKLFSFQVIGGPTGSGKSELLHALKASGEQVLDLEDLASHRGSVLGNLPHAPQPPQRYFESQLYAALMGFDPARPVFVEAESRRIGLLHLPETLIESMRTSPCIMIDAPFESRVERLKTDYLHLIEDVALFEEMLSRLHTLYSRATLEAWIGALKEGRVDELVSSLLKTHYDPLYARSSQSNYIESNSALKLSGGALKAPDFERMVAAIKAA